ncbi:MAG: hypothetical protein EPO40_05725 [Myxococcaceae bacterium]|nr:MAG: hypothetical protein EPO40_05725 [Myxococcaceae bacterium]
MEPVQRRVIRIFDEDGDHPRIEHVTTRRPGTPTVSYQCTDATSVKDKNPDNFPGWVLVDSSFPGFSNPSLLMNYIRILKSEDEPRRSNWARGQELEQHLRTLRSIFTPSAPYSKNHPAKTRLGPDQGWLRRLKPPVDRHRHKANLEATFEILGKSGWKAPAQGEVFQPPSAHPRFGRNRFLVLSNTLFNQTYFYPEIIVGALTPLANPEADRAQAEAEGLIPVEVESLGGTFVLWPSLVQTISFSVSWFEECYGCHDPENHRPERWRIEGGALDGHCLCCDGAVDGPIWPQLIGKVADEDMKRAIDGVTRHLRLLSS